MDYCGNNIDRFFAESKIKQYVPRAIYADMDSITIDDVRTGAYRQLYHPDQLISAKEDTSNNFARGFYFSGKDFAIEVMDRIRKLAEECPGLQGFIFSRSLSGGTGSGFGSQLL